MNALYGGVNAAAITPVTADMAPDLDRMARHCRWLLANGCNGLGVLGTTGEANSFGVAERMAILEGLVARGIPAERLMPGTGMPSITDTVQLTNHARELRCRGVLVLPPFFYKNPSDDGLFAHFDQVIQRIGGGLAIYLYHFPQQSAVPFSHALIERLLDAHPDVVKGVKDSSGDLANMLAMVERFAPRGFEVYCGADDLYPTVLRAGGAGCITAASNVNCAAGAAIYANPDDAVAEATLKATRKAVTRFNLIASLKALVARLHGDDGFALPRPPHLKLTADQQRQLFTDFDATGVALPKAA
jgi:4-hydroxy-tetrahydrodipicolinate synthase